MRKYFDARLILSLLVFLMSGTVASADYRAPVNLETADNFAVLAGISITNTGDSVINGDVGVGPGTVLSGFGHGSVIGTLHVADVPVASAKADLARAARDILGRTQGATVPSELGGTIQTPGIYASADGTFAINGKLTLDAKGDPNAVFIFKTTSTLATARRSEVVLAGGAQACNVFWAVGDSVNLGEQSILRGNILALTTASLSTGAVVEGRVLAEKGTVSLNGNIITRATCAPPPTSSQPADTIATPPLISILQVPSPLSLPEGPGSVTYTYTVLNVGKVAIGNVTVGDDKCASVNLISGDTNSDSKLDIKEKWTYRCTARVTQTTTNIGTAVGFSNGLSAIDSAVAKVTVGVSFPAPLISVIKTPDRFVLPIGGGDVTYTYVATNPGTVALSNVSVADNTCNTLSVPSGDFNENSLLDTGESWVYTCTMHVSDNSVSTVTATADGSGNGLTAIDYALTTVVVASPNLVKFPHFANNDDKTAPVLFDVAINPASNNNSDAPLVILIAFVLLATLFAIWAIRKKEKRLLQFIFLGSALFLLLFFFTIGNQPPVSEPAPSLPSTGSTLPTIGRLKIPNLNIDAPIVPVGLTTGGLMDVPSGYGEVGWFNLGARIGGVGSAVIDGHTGFLLDGKAEVFNKLIQMVEGDKLTVVDEKGKTLTFAVREIRIYKSDADASDVFSSSDGGIHLNIITCLLGSWDESIQDFTKRLVIFTDLVPNSVAIVPPAISPVGIAPQGVSLGSPFTFTRSLTIGSTGDDVVALQKFLIANHFLNIPTPTGYFGPITRSAVVSWQTANAILPPTGFFGPISLGRLNSILSKQSGVQFPITGNEDASPN
ncbi:MAG: ice-binding family protein [Candidatus Taylorbacteria bacterium]